jgi:hypothetical protein
MATIFIPFLPLDINVKYKFKATFINIMYAYFQPFWRNFNFLNKIHIYIFFYQGMVLFEHLFKNRIAINNTYLTITITLLIVSKKMVYTLSFALKYFFVNLLVFYYFVVIYYLLQPDF